jgi:hypothetical protein
MMERRNVVGAGLAAGIASLVASADGDAAQNDNPVEVSRAVNDLRRTIEANYSSPWTRIAQIREQQRIWMRTAQKFPDFIEIGLGVWEGLFDWHVRFQQPINMTRLPDGRYAMSFMFTTLVLRPEVDANYVGPAFDNDRRPGGQ